MIKYNNKNYLIKNIPVCKLGFGTCQIGGPAKLGKKIIGMGNQKKKDSIEALSTALDKGINFFDTADIYGKGKSEKILGEICKGKNDIILCTKFGNRIKNNKIIFDSSVKYLEFSLNGSLKRLNRDYIDILLLHSPPKNIKLNKQFIKKIINLKAEGKITYFGISFSTVTDAINYIKFDNNNLDFIEIIYNIVDRRAESYLFLLCKKNNIKIIARMPFASGFLSKVNINKKYKKNDFRKYYNRHFIDWIKIIHKDSKKLFTKNINLAELSLKYILSKKEIFVVIPGMRTKKQVLDNYKYFSNSKLTRSTLDKVDKLPLFYKDW